MGAGKWTSELSQYLSGRHIVILPDNDLQGQKHAKQVAASVAAIAASVKIVELPGLPDKGDVSDWLDGSGTEDELLRLVDQASVWEPPIETSIPGLIRLVDVKPQTVEWLWPGRIPIGKLTLLAGDPGLGKSLITLDMAARVSAGASWPDVPDDSQAAGGVVLLSAEDDLADTIRPRLDAQKADCTRVSSLTTFGDLATDIDMLSKSIELTDNCRLVVVDPISAYMGKADSHNNAEVRAILAPLAQLAAEKRVAILAVTHLRKGEGEPIYRAMGSLAFVASVRTAWVICRDKSDPERRLMLNLKNNVARDSANGLAYIIKSEGPNTSPFVCWEPEPVTITAAEAMAPEQRKRGPAPSAAKSMIDLLAGWIADRGGRVTTREVQQGNRRFGTTKEAEAALMQLVKLGRGDWRVIHPSDKGGRPSRVFVLNISSTSTIPPQPAETSGCVDVNWQGPKRSRSNKSQSKIE
jgi:hypothetical protein